MIEVLCGMIASGKSTYAAERARDGAIVVNDDSIVNAVHGGQYSLYDERLKALYKGVEFLLASTAVAMGRDVVVDNARNLSPKTRAKWVAIARALDAPIHCVAFPVFSPEIHASRRFEADSRGLSFQRWLEVAERHRNELYKSPQESEGFERITYVRWKAGA